MASSSLAQTQSVQATNCQISGGWVERGSGTAWRSAGVLTIGRNLVGVDQHPYCSGPHTETITRNGTTGFTSVSTTAPPPCQNSVATMTFGATCNTASGSFVNADGSSGSLNWVRGQPKKELGGACEDTNTPAGQAGSQCGDPINPTTGNVFEEITDYEGVAASPLRFVRHYSSMNTTSAEMGLAWSHNYAGRLLLLTPTLAQVVSGSGKAITFELVSGQWVADPDLVSSLTQQTVANVVTGWLYRTGNNRIQSFDANGRLVKITETSGLSQTLAYTGNALSTVTDSFGRQLSFAYGANARIASVTVPDLAAYVYHFDTQANLTSVEQPGTTTKTYLYENVSYPNALTGELDENAARFTTWGYNDAGQAQTSQHANGVDLTTVAYGSPTAEDTTITDARGRSRSYKYYNILDVEHTALEDITGTGFAATGSWSYYANGSIASYTDYHGNLTCYGYDPVRNVEVTRIDGLVYPAEACGNLQSYPLPPDVRVTTTTWHPIWRLVVRKSEPKKITTIVYNGQPDPLNGNAVANCAPTTALLPDGSPIAVICRRYEQATTDSTGRYGFAAAPDTVHFSPLRASYYSYNALGQVLTSQSSAGESLTSVYYTSPTSDHAAGDLQKTTDGAGHVTQFVKYDKAGRVLQRIEINGATTNITYTPRGWVKTLSLTPVGGGTPRLTTFTYDGVGQLKVAALPDNTSIQYGYDSAHRLVSVTDGAGNSVTYTLDGVGNRVVELIKDPQGASTRTITRTFDGLNRPSSVTGAAQ